MTKQAYQQAGTPKTRDSAKDALGHLLAVLRSLDWHYRTAHWQVVGEAQYGDHLLFERMYEGLVDRIDGLAEKMVGMYGNSAVDSQKQIGRVMLILENWNQHDCPFKIALTGERDLQLVVQHTYERIKELGQMSLGLDDMLMTIASEHDTNQYLLQQRMYDLLHGNKYAYSSLERSWSGNSTFAPMRTSENDPFEKEDDGHAGSGPAEHYFRSLPKHREVQEFHRSKAVTNLPDVAERAEWTGRGKDVERERAKVAPPSPAEVKDTHPMGKDFYGLSRYVIHTEQGKHPHAPLRTPQQEKFAGWTFTPPFQKEAKKTKSNFIPGLTYETTKDSFTAIHDASELVVLQYEKVEEPQDFVRVADRFLRDMDWTHENLIIEKEKVRQLTRQFERNIEYLEDEDGNPFYRVKRGVL